MVITGIGWVGQNAHGTACLGRRGTHEDWRHLYRSLREEGVIPSAIPEFGRFDADSKRVCLAVGLALHDAGIAPHSEEAVETGLFIAGPDGAQAANLAYFRDYVASGRTLGRGNLFIYTLPTSPAAEAAISFGLCGPLLYVGRPASDNGVALREAADLVTAGQADTMLCIVLGPDDAVCYAVRSQVRPDKRSLPLNEAFEADGALASPDRTWASGETLKGPA